MIIVFESKVFESFHNEKKKSPYKIHSVYRKGNWQKPIRKWMCVIEEEFDYTAQYCGASI